MRMIPLGCSLSCAMTNPDAERYHNRVSLYLSRHFLMVAMRFMLAREGNHYHCPHHFTTMVVTMTMMLIINDSIVLIILLNAL